MKRHEPNKIIEEDVATIARTKLPWELFSGKSVLIAGATGFIAAYIVETLLYINDHTKRKPTRVICLVRNKQRAVLRFSHYRNHKGLVFWVQDVCDPIRHTEKVDYIIHAASNATPSKYGIDPVGTLLPNVLGTYYLLEYAKRSCVKCFLFISSGEVYGSKMNRGKGIQETHIGLVDPLLLRSCYAESKRMGETMCKSWFEQYGTPIKIARLFHTYGPGMTLGDGRVHSDFVDAAVHKQDIIMKSDGRAVRTFCYIADTVRGLFTILGKGKYGEAYNVGSSRKISVRKLAETIASLNPKQPLRITRDVRDQGKSYLPSASTILCPDISKIKKLGWHTTYSLGDGFRRTIQSYL